VNPLEFSGLIDFTKHLRAYTNEYLTGISHLIFPNYSQVMKN